MLNIPSTIKALYQTDGIRKNFRVHFPNGEYSDLTNSNVVVESVKFTESLCSQSTFKFGLAEASVLEFETVGVGNMYGMTIEASIEIDTSSLSGAQIADIVSDAGDGTIVLAAVSDIGYGFYRIPLGTFKVDSCPRDHQSMAHRQVTAYGDTMATPRLGFPSRMAWENIYGKTSAILSAATAGGMTLASTDTMSAISLKADFREIILYDSAGNGYGVRLQDGDNSYAPMTYRVPVYNLSGDEYPSFFKMQMADYNARTYDSFGAKVAKTITNAGYDFRYDASGAMRFASTEDALRYCAPWLFAPTLVYDITKTGDTPLTMCPQSVRHNTLTPVIVDKDQADANNRLYGWHTVPNDGSYINNGLVYAIVKPTAGKSVRIHLDQLAGGHADIDIDRNLEGYLTSVPTINRYTLDTYAGEITIKNTGEAECFYDMYGSSVSSSIYKRKGYSYDIPASDILNLYQGAVEMFAEFGKTNRLGGFETVRLDNTSPMSIITDNYSECWWDEYDVDPIGMVNVTYQDTDENGNPVENTTVITIGSGQSVYDMSNNAAMKNLGSASLSAVTALIKANFAPYLSTVTFTPIELTMQGWPWLEAGDALEITAEDGTVVESYALRVEMSGIQNLSSVITAEGGEIIEEVE